MKSSCFERSICRAGILLRFARILRVALDTNTICTSLRETLFASRFVIHIFT